MVRRHSNLILASSVALLVAAVLGVQLGESAIAEINPVHFRGALEPPIGIDPNQPVRTGEGFASAYGWDQGYAARAIACGGNCNAPAAGDIAVFPASPPPLVRASGPYWRDATPVAEPKPWPPGEVDAERPLSVERYMHYPVEEAQAAAGEDSGAPPAGEDEDTGDDGGDDDDRPRLQ